MKIAIIGHKRIPSNEGGIEKGVEQHAVRMVQRGNDVTVYNRGGHNVFGKEFDIISNCNKLYTLYDNNKTEALKHPWLIIALCLQA